MPSSVLMRIIIPHTEKAIKSPTIPQIIMRLPSFFSFDQRSATLIPRYFNYLSYSFLVFTNNLMLMAVTFKKWLKYTISFWAVVRSWSLLSYFKFQLLLVIWISSLQLQFRIFVQIKFQFQLLLVITFKITCNYIYFPFRQHALLASDL
jgi:hypothetical protein